MDSTPSDLATLARETKKPEEELKTLALQVGIRQLWRKHVLAQYLREDISREEAAEAVGVDWVELAERQHEAMREDLAWALGE